MHPPSIPLILAILTASSISCGCASKEACVKPVGSHDLTPSEVTASSRGIGKVVSWGGQVIETRNLETFTELEILGYPLDPCGRPVTQGQPLGRFLVRHHGYLEPMDYRAGRQVTVTGRITEVTEGQVGDTRLRFPILQESVIRLWPQQQTPGALSARPTRPLFSIGIGGGSGHVGGGIGVSF